MHFKSFDKHQVEVGAVKRQLLEALKAKKSIFRDDKDACHHTTTRFLQGGESYCIDFSKFKSVIDIDIKERVAWVEPGVTMDALVRATLQKNLIPSVVPEFKGITVGGAVMGAALESSSWRYGQFSDICDEYELLIGDGSAITVTRNRDPELFYGISGSYSSLAKLSLVKLRLDKATPFVRVVYQKLVGLSNIAERLVEICKTSPDYLEAIAFGENGALIIRAYRVEEKDVPKRTTPISMNNYWSKWFCHHAWEKFHALEHDGSCCEDFFGTYDYLFRFDRGAFWMGQFVTNNSALWRYLLEKKLSSHALPTILKDSYQKKMPSICPSFLFRLLFGWKLSSRQLYKMLHALPKETYIDTFLVQDFYIPTERVHAFVAYLCKEISIFPLWFCPMRGTTTPQFFSPHYLGEKKSSFPAPDFINVGVYGIPKNKKPVLHNIKKLEELCYSLGGRKMLYSFNSDDEEEFWNRYDKSRYDAIREKYHADPLMPDIFLRTHH